MGILESKALALGVFPDGHYLIFLIFALARKMLAYKNSQSNGNINLIILGFKRTKKWKNYLNCVLR